MHTYSSIYGKEIARQMRTTSYTFRDHKIQGLIGLPSLSRANRTHGLFFLNGRPIRHFGLLNSVVEAYGHALPIHRYPVFALQIFLDPSLADVNVHPTKLEVRFSEEEDIRAAVFTATERALQAAPIIPAFGASSPRMKSPYNEQNVTQEALSLGPSKEIPRPTESIEVRTYKKSPDQVYEIGRELYAESQSVPAVQAPQFTQESVKQGLGLTPVAQTLGMYVLAENADGLYIIDQHAAHERILYERFSRNYKHQEVSQLPLLLPLTRDLTPQEFLIYGHIRAELTKLGFETEPFGEQSILIRSVPGIWSGQQPETLAVEFLDEFFETPAQLPSILEKLEDRIIMKACKAAIKANQWLSMPEMAALCKGLDELDDPFHCPHGRPILLHFSHYQLEKQFKRVM